MTVTDRVEVNPGVMLGKAVIRGTRIPVELILRELSESAAEADLIDAYTAHNRRHPRRDAIRGRHARPRRSHLHWPGLRRRRD
jgi:hypothetical protein